MNKYELTTEKKKAAIIQSALSLFKKRGIINVSMKEIALDAQVSQASIYNYFGSKETVVAECITIVMEDTYQRADEILQRDISFLDKLNLALSLCTEGLNTSISKYFTEKALQDQTLEKLLLENVNQGKKRIYRQYIELGKKENIIDASIPTDIYLGFMEAINTIGFNAENDDDMDKNIKYFHKLFLYGLIGK